jgi:hypothetical protein
MYLVNKHYNLNNQKLRQEYFGLTLFHYFAPDLLGKFAGNDNELDAGGSLAYFLEYRISYDFEQPKK